MWIKEPYKDLTLSPHDKSTLKHHISELLWVEQREEGGAAPVVNCLEKTTHAIQSNRTEGRREAMVLGGEVGCMPEH